MSKILDSYKTTSAIDDIILSAKKFVVLICPFAPDNDIIFRNYIEMRNRNSEDVLLVFFLRSSWTGRYNDEYKNDDLAKIFKRYGIMKNVLLFRIPISYSDFHAKCYFNESKFLISSMNLSYAMRKSSSLECSVLVSKDNDNDEFSQCLRWFNLFGKYIGLNPYFIDGILNNSLTFGYCIMCGVNIPLENSVSVEENIPFCVECRCRYYDDMERRISRTYRYCLKCGDPVGNINVNKPICWDCRGKNGNKLAYELRY